MNMEENQLAKDLLTGRSSITYVKKNYSMKFMMRASTKKKDLYFFKTLFRYLTQKKYSSLYTCRKIYNFNFPSDESSFVMMEIKFDRTSPCTTADDRWESYKKLMKN